ncbi:MAG: hypothetical protein O7C59_07995 [Rickettsia endosymbiont of Ixodes persulcatus]|nr:hypothetical protein [Rickettsia endosymbiont of Ixodes persulcatus]
MTDLVIANSIAATLTPTPQITITNESQLTLLHTNKQLFETSYVTCHDTNLQNMPNHSPSLIDTNNATMYFQISTNHMPTIRNKAQAPHKNPIYNKHQINTINTYIQTNDNDPITPQNTNNAVTNSKLINSNVAHDSNLFRLNYTSCHNFTNKNEALSSNKYAPTLDKTTPTQIYTTILTNPQNMPKFTNQQLNPKKKHNIMTYVRQTTKTPNPNNYNLNNFNPAPKNMTA